MSSVKIDKEIKICSFCTVINYFDYFVATSLNITLENVVRCLRYAVDTKCMTGMASVSKRVV